MTNDKDIEIDELQEIKIKLSEFLKLKEVYNHRKEIKIEEKFITKGINREYEGSNLT
jgi:hypothetical protein